MDTFFDRNNKRWFYLAVLTVSAFLMQISMVAASAAAMQPVVSGLSVHKGPASGGTPVTVSGNGFRTGDKVMFGAVPAEKAVVVSPYIINTISPSASGGVVDVRVAFIAGFMKTVSAVTPADRFAYAANYKKIGRKFVKVIHTPNLTLLTHGSLLGSLRRNQVFHAPNFPLQTPPRRLFLFPTVTVVNPPVGPPQGGTPITITGSGFIEGATEVAFNLVTGVPIINGYESISANCPKTLSPASITFINNNEIQLNTPPDIEAAQPGAPAQPVPTDCPYVVSVTTPGGTYGTETITGDEFLYYANPPSSSPATHSTSFGITMKILVGDLCNTPESAASCNITGLKTWIYGVSSNWNNTQEYLGHYCINNDPTYPLNFPNATIDPNNPLNFVGALDYSPSACKVKWDTQVTFIPPTDGSDYATGNWEPLGNIQAGDWDLYFGASDAGYEWGWAICGISINAVPASNTTFTGLANTLVIDLGTGLYIDDSYNPNTSSLNAIEGYGIRLTNGHDPCIHN